MIKMATRAADCFETMKMLVYVVLFIVLIICSISLRVKFKEDRRAAHKQRIIEYMQKRIQEQQELDDKLHDEFVRFGDIVDKTIDTQQQIEENKKLSEKIEMNLKSFPIGLPNSITP